MQLSQADKEALIALFQRGDFEKCFARADILTRTHPNALDAWNLRGAAAFQLERIDEAELSFRQLETLAPDLPSGPYNLGQALEKTGAWEDAAKAYQRAIHLAPESALGHLSLGHLHLRLGSLDLALAHSERAAQLQPTSPEAHNNLGTVLERLGRLEEAQAAFERAVQIKGDFVPALYNIGTVESAHRRHGAAADAFRKVLSVEPNHALGKAMLLHELSHLCAFDEMAEHSDAIPDLGVKGAAVPPFVMLPLEDHPAHQLTRARNWAEARYGSLSPTQRTFAKPKSRPNRLRIAYLSADFRDHPAMRLMSGVLAEHDRSRFEVHAISYGPHSSDEWRAKAINAVDHFHDVHDQADSEVFERLEALDLDIAIERQGFTQGTRIDWLARRIAPVQISYLGYCSGTSLPFIDYMVADKVIIPEQLRAHYDENIIWLPDSYQPGNNTLEIAQERTTREQHGLPDDAIVLCCFNSLHKLSPQVFAIWMRILQRIKGSVLWLLGSNDEAHGNLRDAAVRAGIDPARLIFAQRIPHAEHLERHAHADLFIDTAPYGAHTTCNDALWAGLPVITMAGQQMSARVAASVLTAAGLPELITPNWQAYEELIVDLAGDKTRRDSFSAKLAMARGTAPMFDTALYTRHLEDGFDAAYARFLKDEPPADITVQKRD
ncbi:tetratricopeptide repeat protein [Erythrobacter sp. SCSIO 43205]|uniref:O-linked N-acetylglucosamine transferase, SPINDLY family protein n=1 Tax=Erythrobacter sp. SCSIO 43205 TaxID=2779361 RepID=UPI001CA8721C|nr:tetratricopeptide repeat protein [Erythrobacter sp. SCSIO 43205]UAB77291.1 tetratricopeptide repeat protein [Erythrobacter sp. SCSIO 43205]